MSDISRKKLAAQIRDLLDRKGEIDKPGQVVAYIINELRLVGDRTVREPVIEAILKLEEQEIVEVQRNGNVISSIRRTARKRARSNPQDLKLKATKETPVPTHTPTPMRSKTTPPAQKSAYGSQPVRRPAKPSYTTETPKTSPAPVSATAPVMEDPKVELDAPSMTPMEIIVKLTEKVETQKRALATAEQNLAAKDAVIRSLAADKTELDSIISRQQSKFTNLQGEFSLQGSELTGLREQHTALMETVQTGADALGALKAEYDRLKGEYDDLKGNKEDDLKSLIERVSAAMS